jgi:hypothetical protein
MEWVMLAAEKIQEIRQGIARDHSEHPHGDMPRDALKIHLVIHELVEKQLFEGDPPEAKEALARLFDKGLSRHEAIHAIGKVITHEAYGMMRGGRPLDQESYRQLLRQLGADG